MSAITLVNSVPGTVASLAEFHLYQGIDRVARVGVRGGGEASIPTTTTYTFQASTSMGEFSLTSNEIELNLTSAVLRVRMLEENGHHDFQLTLEPGLQPYAFTLENTWSQPVQFKLTRPNSPFQIVTVVEENNNATVSTAQQWTIYAIVNGITTPTVSISDPNATVTLVAHESDGTFSLVVS